jgi:hypothetical protein
LTLKYDEAISTFAFNFNLRRYTLGQMLGAANQDPSQQAAAQAQQQQQ